MENHIFLVKGEMGKYLNVSKSANWKKDIYHWIQILYTKCVRWMASTTLSTTTFRIGKTAAMMIIKIGGEGFFYLLQMKGSFARWRGHYSDIL